MRVVFLAPYPVDRLMINYRGDLRSHSAAGEIHDSEINCVARSADIHRTGKTEPVGAGTPVNVTRGRIEGMSPKEGFPGVRVLLGEPQALVSRNHFPALRAFA